MDRSAKDILYHDTISRKTGNIIDIFQIFIILPFARASKYFSSVTTMILQQIRQICDTIIVYFKKRKLDIIIFKQTVKKNDISSEIRRALIWKSLRSVHRDDSSIIDSREESNKTYLGKKKRIGRPLQYRAASSLISSEKKRRKRDDNRPTLIPISSVYRKQGKENFAFDICSIQRIRIDIRRYSIRVHESTGFVREKCIVHSSVWAPFYADGTYWINQPEGNSVSIEICHEFSFPSIHSPPPSSSTIRFSQRDPKRLFDNRCWWNRSYKSGIDFHWKKFNNFLLLYGIWILGQRRILVTLYIYILRVNKILILFHKPAVLNFVSL